MLSLIQRDYPFENKEEASEFFTKLTGLPKKLNYSELNTKEYNSYRAQIDLLNWRRRWVAPWRHPSLPKRREFSQQRLE